jgi:hypothetical protein
MVHTTTPVAEAIVVFDTAAADKFPLARALPALKPYQPIHNIAAPRVANGTFEGGTSPWCLYQSVRLPNIIAITKHDIPDDV